MDTVVFNIGDQVVHCVYGPGEVIQLDKKEISGHSALYYVVKSGTLTLWVPVESKVKPSLRRLTPAGEFKKLLAILTSPSEPLSGDRLERKTFLIERMHDGTLESICRVVRDLYSFSRMKKMSDYDVSIMERARDYLLKEWRLALSVPLAQAESELKQLLESGTHSSDK